MDTQRIEELEITCIGKRYAELRIVNPRAEAHMEKSLGRYGQMQPVVCVAQGAGVELVDGFKRLRAMQKLKRAKLVARVTQELPTRMCKTLIVQLNQRSLSINVLEEALVIASLHREENLKQVEIAALFGRDKSWVSRRLGLEEKLHEEVRTHIRLGLLPQTAGRELIRLPRGNQPEVLACVLAHHLTSRQTAKLVTDLVPRPRYEYPAVLRSPWEVVGDDAPRPYSDLTASLQAMRRNCRQVVARLAAPDDGKPEALIREALTAGEAAVKALKTCILEGWS